MMEVDPGAIAPLMGRSRRHPITGKVTIPNNQVFKDFVLVDMWSRDVIEGSAENLQRDPYIFLPVPLPYRTWVYHFEYLHNRVESGDENGMVKRALQHRCIDAPVSGGRWSPVMALIPIAIAVSLWDNMVLLVPTLGMVLAGQSLSHSMNTAPYYRLTRLATFLPRFIWYIVLLVSFLMDVGRHSGLAILGFLFALGAVAYDVIEGDVAALRTFQLHCSYEVISVLPKRVFICKRSGAAWTEDLFGSRGQMPECISGFAPWERHHVLIADIQGILFELRPMKPEDWTTIYDQSVVFGEDLSFLGLDIFSPSMPTAKAVQAEQDLMKKAKLAMKMAKR